MNLSVKAYQALLEMETENQKINKMILAPRYAKLLNESADADDFAVHRAKTIEALSEFVNKTFDSMMNIVSEASTEIKNNRLNNRLVLTCENKMKSLTREDIENLTLESTYLFDVLTESKNDIIKDINSVTTELSKILECNFKSKEEYSKTINSFKELISECGLNKVCEGSDIELSSVLKTYKNTDILIENDISVLSEINSTLEKCKDSVKTENLFKIKESVYAAANYLMPAMIRLEEYITRSHMNISSILCEFVSSDFSDESTALFESTMSNIIRQYSVEDDDDDFI